MNQPYNFSSGNEPSEEQLTGLMQAVLQDVKERAEIAEKKLKSIQIQQIREAFAKQRQDLEQHG